jgi:hypothetical protein
MKQNKGSNWRKALICEQQQCAQQRIRQDTLTI